MHDYVILTLLIGGSSYMTLRADRLIFLLLLIVSFASIPEIQAQAGPEYRNAASETGSTDDAQEKHADEVLEGSPERKAASEFAHHLAGFFDVTFGLAEMRSALQYPLPSWTRFILPGALTVVGGYLLIWSDHEAWPIGSLSFAETFFGRHHEIIQHKSYAILALAIALFEMLRRTGQVRHPAWAAPLILLVLASALSLFDHSHANHPAAAKIQLHHSLLGIVGVGAAFSKGMASWLPGASSQVRKWWEVAWAGSIILFGLLLLAYSE